jgi:hypothetical protein
MPLSFIETKIYLHLININVTKMSIFILFILHHRCVVFFFGGGCSVFKIEASSAFHFEGLSNLSLSVEVLIHHTEDFLRHTSET